MRNQVGALTFLGSFPGELPKATLPEVAFAGRSNVGKSSLLNALLRNHKAARVSSTPGRTQAINLFQLGRAGVFADLPGYGFANAPDAVVEAWKPMIERYLGERETLRGVVCLVDVRLPAQEADGDLIQALQDAEIPFLVVATKIDKLSKHERKPALQRLATEHGLDRPPLGVSAKDGDGIDALWEAIEDLVRA